MAVRKKKASKKKSDAGATKKKSAGGGSAKRPAGAKGGKAKPKSQPAKKPAKVAKRPAAKANKASSAKDKERLKREREREKAALEKEKLRARKEKEREKAAEVKERAREKLEKEREKAREAKEKEREQKEREREKAKLEKERAKAKAEQEKLKAKQQAEKEAQRQREIAAKKAEKEAERRAKEQEKERIKAEKEAERQRLIAEREEQREAARRAKEEERARVNAEREAYRKAKEAERERLRAEKEAARRLREGKIARASKNAQRDGLRVAARVYDPAAVPNQSGTTRRAMEAQPQRFVGLRMAEYHTPAASVAAAVAAAAMPQPPPQPAPEPVATDFGSVPPTTGVSPSGVEARPTPVPPATPESIEERYRLINERLQRAEESFRRQYDESFEMSWIHHDSALEGVVYTFQELKTAMDPTVTVVPDSSMQPVCEEIRRHRQAIAYVRELGERKRVPINVDVMKKIYCILHPEEGDVKTVKYRKDIPQHRLYFHEYAPPDKIAYRVRQVIDWLNGPEPKKIKNPMRVAARVHYDLLRIFPFPQDSGKVARLLMNILLLRGGYPPAIIHSTERQKYYEALKGQLPIIFMLVNDSISNALMSIEKLLDEHEQHK
ncbi:MAG TPA: Fic family protein [Polyangiaceae bacterium]|nr:Fic family protein [Polyangiaceae bacterium]